MEDNEQEYEQIKTSNVGIQRYVNVLELLDSNPTLKDYYLYMAGYDVVNVDGVDIIRRINKPMFSDDFSKTIILEFKYASNIVTTQTTFTAEEIRLHLQHKALWFNNHLCWNGRSYYITRAIWQSLREHWAEIGADWTQKHITSNMVERYRTMEDLGDFTAEVTMIINNYNLIVRAALNRSLNALTLEHHKQVEIAEQKITQPRRRRMFGMRRGSQNDVS